MKNIKLKIFTVIFLTIFVVFILNCNAMAAGIDGTTIVLNPRTWWKLDRLCKWQIWTC